MMNATWVDLSPISKDEIVGYGNVFDPQAQHIDEAAAAETIFGGLVMAGSHLAALAGRAALTLLMARANVRHVAAIENLRWLRPIRPGARLRIAITDLTEAADQSGRDAVIRVAVTVELASGERAADMTLVAVTEK